MAGIYSIFYFMQKSQNIIGFLLISGIAFSCNWEKKVTVSNNAFIEAAQKKSYSNRMYFFDSTGYYDFISNETPENLNSLVYGFFYGDSLFKRPALLSKKVPTCLSVMLKEIDNKTTQAWESSFVMNNQHVFTRHLIKINGTESYYPDKLSNRYVVVLLFSASLGKKYDSFFNQAIEICDKNNYIPVIISLDPIYFGKH